MHYIIARHERSVCGGRGSPGILVSYIAMRWVVWDYNVMVGCVCGRWWFVWSGEGECAGVCLVSGDGVGGDVVRGGGGTLLGWATLAWFLPGFYLSWLCLA